MASHSLHIKKSHGLDTAVKLALSTSKRSKGKKGGKNYMQKVATEKNVDSIKEFLKE